MYVSHGDVSDGGVLRVGDDASVGHGLNGRDDVHDTNLGSLTTIC